MSRIRPFIGNELIKVLTGIRRSGKSVMLSLIQEELAQNGVQPEQFISLNFENMSNAHLCTAVALHDEILRRTKEISGKVYLFFDEIQEVADWEKCINSFRVEYEGADERQCFTKYLTRGGMPYLSNLRYDDAASRQYLRDLFNSVELKDIIKRNNIRDVDMLERIIAYITSNIGTTFSSTAISKYLKSEGRSVSPETVLNYIKACTDAFLFYQVKRQDLQGKKILTVNEKYYVADHGVREAVYGGNMKDINLVLENVVYMELLRRGYSVTVGKVSDKEIDFVCEDHGKKLYVQVSYLLASEETIQREFGAFAGVRDNFPKYVVTMDELDMSRDGIKHRNIRDFLLAEEWN